jgi:alpha-N-arabinofuranosidase
VIEAMRELKLSVVRWPGGCFADDYHWEDGIGPREERPRTVNARWGQVIDTNEFGTHEFIALCRRLGAEPYICQNGLADVEEMAEWVAYCNAISGPFAGMRRENGHAEPYNVRYWSVGNERSGKDYIDRVRDATIAMKQMDPTIQVTCSGSHGPRAHIDPYLFETAGNHLNLLSVHEYWVANYQKHHAPDYLSCMMLSEKPDAHISAVVKSIDGAGMRGRIKIAFDEWNLRSWHHPGFSGHRARKVDYQAPEIIALFKARDKSLDPSLYTMADALFCASFFNACLRHSEDVGMANIAPLVNTTGPLFVHPDGIVKRTHFHTMAMYANLLRERVAAAEVKSAKLTHGDASGDVVDAIATVDATGKRWAIALVNRHPSESVACALRMEGVPLDGAFSATCLTADSPDAYNDTDTPDRVAPKKVAQTFNNGTTILPPHSLTIVGATAEDILTH